MKINIKQALLALLAVPALALSVAAVPALAADDMTLTNGINSTKTDEQPRRLFGDGGVFETVSKVLLFVIGAISVIMLIVGGIRYTVSQGDSAQVTSAKNTILYSIVGLVIAILAFAAVDFVAKSLVAQ